MRSRRSTLADLERGLHLIEPGEHTLGVVLASANDDLVARLGITHEELREFASRPDEEVAPRLRGLLQRMADARAARHGRATRQTSHDAALRLAATAMWRDHRLAIDPTVLFGDLLADASRKFVKLHAPGEFDIALPRSFLIDVGRALRPFAPGVVTWLDAEGLHVRWHRGRGGMNLLSRPIPPREASAVLHVELPSRPARLPAAPEHPISPPPQRPLLPSTPDPRVAVPPHQQQVSRRPVAARRLRDGWFAELLSHIAVS